MTLIRTAHSKAAHSTINSYVCADLFGAILQYLVLSARCRCGECFSVDFHSAISIAVEDNRV